MTLSVITPTADRPVAFGLAERWMARQTRRPDEWIVADGGLAPIICTQGQRHLHDPRAPGVTNFLRNLQRGLAAARGDIVVWVEDDDWYAPQHLEVIAGQFADGILAAGDDLQQYYHLPRRLWRTFNNRGASLCQTAFRRDLAPVFLRVVEQCLAAKSYGVDGMFWAGIPATQRSLVRQQTVVGMKGLPGRAGLGIGHRPTGPWHADPQGAQLRRWLGEDVSVYHDVVRVLPGTEKVVT